MFTSSQGLPRIKAAHALFADQYKHKGWDKLVNETRLTLNLNRHFLCISSVRFLLYIKRCSKSGDVTSAVTLNDA